MKVITYNIRSWYRDIKAGPRNWKKRAADIKALLAKEQPDVILLQEALPPMTARCIPDGYVKASGCSISHHIYIRKDYAEVESHAWHLRWCRARIRLKNASRFNIVCVHTRWEERIYKATCEDIRDIKSHGATTIAGGDWNNEPATIRPEIWPFTLRTTEGPTFANWEGKGTGNLDYFAGDNLGGATVRPAMGADFTVSDHIPVMITIP